MKTRDQAKGAKAGAGKQAAGKAPAKKAAPPATVDPETGIRLDKVKPEVLDAYLKKFGLPTDGPIGDRLRRLSTWLLERVDKKRRAVCGTCDGRSDARLAMCPFCGDQETDQPVDEKAAIAELKGASPSPAAAPASVAAPSVVGPASRAPAPPKAAAGKAEPAPPPAPPPAAEPPAPPESGPVAVGAELVPAGGGELGVLAAAIAATPGTGTVADLDASIARMREHHRSAIGNIYDFGVELFRCFSEKLYLRRAQPGSGEPVYESWTAFVATELEDVCTVQYSYTLMRICRTFPRELVLKPGMIKKLSLLLRVTDAELAKELEGALDAGMTVKQLQARVTEAVAEGRATAVRPAIEGGRGFAGAPNLDGRPPELPSVDQDEPADRPPQSELTEEDLEGIQNDGLDSMPEPRGKKQKEEPAAAPGKGGKKPEPPPPPPPAPKVCTVTLEYGKKKHAALKRPLRKDDAPKQAKKLADDPWYEEELPNGARLVVKLVSGKKGLEFVREFLPPKA
jgi:hypothetical protein